VSRRGRANTSGGGAGVALQQTSIKTVAVATLFVQSVGFSSTEKIPRR